MEAIRVRLIGLTFDQKGRLVAGTLKVNDKISR
jgi:hypothetical protein